MSSTSAGHISTQPSTAKTVALAHWGLIATNLFFAININTVKYLTGNGFIKPLGLNLVRIGVAATLFWILLAFKPTKVTIQKAHWPRFIGCALCGIALNQILFVAGVSLTLSIHSALLILVTPILITVMSAIFLRDRMNLSKYAGLLLGMGGAVILVMFRTESGSSSNILLGDILVAANAMVYAFYFILVKPLMNSYPPIMVIRWVFTLAFFMVLPFCWRDFSHIPWQQYTTPEYASLIAIVIGGTFLAYLFNIYGIKILGPGITGAYIYTQPLFAATIAIVFLNESLGWYKIIAAVLIFSGVALVNRKQGSHS
jgi:drug/metabolite transporter (DMT)-like permease